MSDQAIQVKNISKTFNIVNSKSIISRFLNSKTKEQTSLKAIDNISFEIKKGEILGIIGANGSGKSTLLRIIGGIYRPDSGSVVIHGRLSPLLQLGVGFHSELIAKENILMSSLLMGFSKSFIENKIEDIIQYAELEKFRKLKLKHYSTGMKARLGFAISMLIDPDIFLIDEILSVGDIKFREKSYQSFKELKNRKKTILLTTHNLAHLADLVDRVLFIQNGKIKKIGKPNEVIKEYMESNTLGK